VRRSTREAAIAAVDLPEGVVDLLCTLRNWLQDKAEPPIVVSDRRFMKAVNLLQARSADPPVILMPRNCA
jgi:MoxR-like ATPase